MLPRARFPITDGSIPPGLPGSAQALPLQDAPALWHRLPASGRLFVKFWGGAGAVLFASAIILSLLPAPKNSRQDVDRLAAASAGGTSAAGGSAAQNGASSIGSNGVKPIAEPVPALLAALPGDADHHLPQRGPNGELPRETYAAALPVVPAGNARVALLLDGFGMAQDISDLASRTLPYAVSFAIPPYAPANDTLLQETRHNGHELFLSLPMEPGNAPVDDEGEKAMGYDHSSLVDQSNLRWALSRFDGYVGVTNAFSGQDGNAYGQSADFRMVASDLDKRGLLYLNATPGAPRYGPVVGGDAALTIDTASDAAGLDAQLAWLVQIAQSKGEAIAVAGPIRPVLIERIAAWADALASKGVTLVPVSALSNRPAMVRASIASQVPQSNTPATGSSAVVPAAAESEVQKPASPTVKENVLPPPSPSGVAPGGGPSTPVPPSSSSVPVQ